MRCAFGLFQSLYDIARKSFTRAGGSFYSGLNNDQNYRLFIRIDMQYSKGEKISMIKVNRAIRSELRDKKFAVIKADEFSIAPELNTDKQHLWADWGNLEADNYLKDGGRFRQRRFGLFYLLPNTGELLPMQAAAYTQSLEVNTYAGGIERKFEPLFDETLNNQFLHELIKFNFQQFPVESSMINQPWEIDVHQFRIVATQDEQGEPTPEGVHHDGDDFNCIYMVNRQNAKGGVSTICDNDKNPLASLTLIHPMDSIMVWDPYVMHGVTPIFPENQSEPAIRDVLVIGYNHRPELRRPM